MFTSMNLSDRLKAAVNTLEATGTSLQARAIQSSRPTSPNVPTTTTTGTVTSPSSTSAANLAKSLPTASSPVLDRGDDTTTRPPLQSTSALAEGALSGLRKSFAFGSNRGSHDGVRPSSSQLNLASGAGETPSSPQQASRPSSPTPARFLNPPSQFALGSGDTSVNPTPHAPRSPQLSHLAQSTGPPPNPDDPASFPLPPSPSVPPALGLGFVDPLGASPLPSAALDAGPAVEEPIPLLETGDGVDAGTVSVGVPHGEESNKDADIEQDGKSNGAAPEASEGVQNRLQDLEKRHAELQKRNEQLESERDRTDKVLQELTSADGLAGGATLEDRVKNLATKVDVQAAELKQLHNKIALQDSRMEELRDTHRLEGTSQHDLIAKLRSQLSTAESNVAQKAAELMTLQNVRSDLAKAQTTAKEEEEKRTKAVQLLKTVRMKLVKAEKDRDEVERDRAEERAERSRATDEVERIKAEKEREVGQLRRGFERELQGAKERFDKELQARKGAWELEMITTKASHAKELSSKSTKVNGLEAIVKELNATKQEQFEAIQSRQAEVESSRAELEALRNRTKELEYQLREASERVQMLEETAASARPSRGRTPIPSLANGGPGSRSPTPSRSNSYSALQSAAEVQRLLAEADARAEAKLSDLRFKIRSLEKERNESEEEWAGKLQERARELDKLRRQVSDKEGEYTQSLQSVKEREDRIGEVEERCRGLEREIQGLKLRIEEGKEDVATAADGERLAKDELASLRIQISTLQSQLDDAKSHATHLKSTNKTLRDELRKIQSSVQLMERQRNPGVGYWSNANPGPSARSAGAPDPTAVEGRRSLESERTGESSPALNEVRKGVAAGEGQGGGGKKENDEEEVNLEYLRNVVLQFLEHKEMRPNLVRVLAVILRFTPQELRRLNAKLLA